MKKTIALKECSRCGRRVNKTKCCRLRTGHKAGWIQTNLCMSCSVELPIIEDLMLLGGSK